MTDDATVVLAITRSELGLIVDALELLEDAEHLRPERQVVTGALLEKITSLNTLCDYAMWELEK